MATIKCWDGAWAPRAGLLALAVALVAGVWVALAPAPANADGSMILSSGNWDPQIRPSGETGNPCTNTRSYAANGGSNSVTFRVTTNGSACSLSGGRNPTTENWQRYEIKVASASGQHGATSAISGANISYVSGLASGTGSWRAVAGTTYNYRAVGVSGAQDSGRIGHDGSVNDLVTTFTVPVTHVGTAYLRFTLNGGSFGAFQVHEHVELAYTDPHVGAVPLVVPVSGVSFESGDLAAATRSYAASGASQEAHIFLRDDWHSNTYTSSETNVTRSAFDSATIKVTSDAEGTTVISGAKISSDAAGMTAVAACTESTPGSTCTITSANFPQASGMNPRTISQDIRFSVPENHVGPAYLFVSTAKSGKVDRKIALQYGNPHVTAVPLAVPQASDGTLTTGDLTMRDFVYAAAGGSQRARILLRDAWHSNTYTATETNVARSAIDSVTIKITSDAAGATAISGATISSDAAGSTAIAACTEATPGDTCTITSANFPQASGMNPKTTYQDIHFSVPGSLTTNAYLVVTAAKSGEIARSFSLLYYNTPPVHWDSPRVDIRATHSSLCEDDADPCTTPTTTRGAPAGFATRPQPAAQGDGPITYADLDETEALKLTAEDGTVVHEDLCPHVASHPLDTTPMAQSDSCTIPRATLMRFQGATSPTAAVQPLEAVYIADTGMATGGNAAAIWKIGGTQYGKRLPFTHAVGVVEAPRAFLDWAEAGRNYAEAKPTVLFAVGQGPLGPGGTFPGFPPQRAMPSGLSWYRFDQLAADKAVELSINQGTISYGQTACTPSDSGCTITLSRQQLRDGTSATADTDLTGNMRLEYVLPLNAAEPTTLTVRAWPDLAPHGTGLSSWLRLSDTAVNRPVASVTVPGDADRVIAQQQTAEIAAGFTAAVDASGPGWGCAGFGPSFLELTGPQTLVEGCTLMRSTADPPGAPMPASGWLTTDSYLVINGPATFTDGGGKRLRLGGTWDRLRCGLAKAQGAPSAGDRDVACWVTNADGERPRISVEAGAVSDIKITTNLEIVEGRTLRLFTGPGAELPLNRYASAVAFDLPGTVFGSGTIKVGSVKELASVSLGRTPVDGIVPTGPVRVSTPAQLRLSLQNENGGATRLAAVSSITVTTTGGGTLGGQYCTAAASCTIGTGSGALAAAAGTNPSVTAAIDLAYTPPSKPGTATIRAAVVGTDGTSFIEEIELTVSGTATDLSVGAAIPCVHSSATENDDRDTIKIPVTAQDANGNAARMPLNVTATVRGVDDAALPAGSHTAEVQCEGGANEARLACNIVVTVTATAAAPLASGTYSATLTGTGIATARASFAVAGPADALTLELPEELGNLAESFSATARAVDKSGQPVADGTWVQFSTAATQGEGSPTVLVTSPPALDHDGNADTPRLRRTQTKNGEAAATVTIVGRGVSVLTATTGAKSATKPVDTRGAQSPQAQTIEAASPGAAPSAGAPATYRGTAATSASQLLAMGPDDATIVWLWNGRRWLRYGEADGRSLPGSIDFPVLPDDLVWFGS